MQIRPAGERALYVELGQDPSPELNQRLRRLNHVLHGGESPGRLPPGILSVIPSYTLLYVEFDPLTWDWLKLLRWIEDAVEETESEELPPVPARRITLPVCYGGDLGPDLEETARELGLEPEVVIEKHVAGTYLVYCVGFSPGFAYLGMLPPELEAGRLKSPRKKVPAGSVAIAGRQTSVYPSETPGGWRLIGRCPVPVYRPWEDPPILLPAGDYVQFRAVDRQEYLELYEEHWRPDSRWTEVESLKGVRGSHDDRNA